MMQTEVIGASGVERRYELFQLGEHGGANLVGGLAIERQFHHTVNPFPSQRFAGEGFHDCFPPYMAAISAE